MDLEAFHQFSNVSALTFLYMFDHFTIFKPFKTRGTCHFPSGLPIVGSCFSLRADHAGALSDSTQRFAKVAAAAHKGHLAKRLCKLQRLGIREAYLLHIQIAAYCVLSDCCECIYYIYI